MVGESCLPPVSRRVAQARRSKPRNPPECVTLAFQLAAKGQDRLTRANFLTFLNTVQGEAGIDEAHVAGLLATFASSLNCEGKLDSLDIHAFLEFLLDPFLNSALSISNRPTQDMTAPLSHYYIYTSHNTYLTGNQLTSRSSVAPIVEALHAGCRVIELDCWSRKGKIMVLHGKTLTRPVPFEDCLKAIKENAFKASEYPVIITIENHLSPSLQAEAAKIIIEILADYLFFPSIEERPPKEFASPEELKRKIIISDTPPHDPVEEQVADDPELTVDVIPDILDGKDVKEETEVPEKSFKSQVKKRLVKHLGNAINAVTVKKTKDKDEAQQQPWSEELEKLLYIFCQKPSEMKDAPINGELVPGERAIMANISEPQLKKLVKRNPNAIIEYTKSNLGRMYPFGLRVDSSNADPFLAWTHGFQLAAVNMQGQDRRCWIARALFDANSRCGYLKKPDVFLSKNDVKFDEMKKMPPVLFLKVKVLMGTDWHRLFDLFKKPDFYVKLVLHGMPFDEAREKTDVIHRCSEPNWEHQQFEFSIRIPNIAVLRFEVWEHDHTNRNDFVGQACFPVTEIKNGIRAIALRSRSGVVLGSKLLCYFEAGEVRNGNRRL